jgi:hypothetical protein
MKCKHIDLREFIFRDGKVVRLCLTCPAFEKERRDVLCPWPDCGKTVAECEADFLKTV